MEPFTDQEQMAVKANVENFGQDRGIGNIQSIKYLKEMFF